MCVDACLVRLRVAPYAQYYLCVFYSNRGLMHVCRRGTTVAIKKAKVFADDDEEFFMELSQEAAIMRCVHARNYTHTQLYACITTRTHNYAHA